MIADDSNSSDSRIPLPPGEASPVALREAGLRRLKDGAFAEAIDLLDRARTIDPEDAQSQLGLGLALQRAGRHVDALEAFGRVQQSMPKDPAAPAHASLSLLALGKAELALRAASEACALSPRLPLAHLAHGQALMGLNELARAEEAFATALRYAPRWADAWVLRAAAQSRQGAIEGAKSALREALRLAPDHAAAKSNLATIENAEGTIGNLDDPGLDRTATVGESILTAWRPDSPAAAVGLAVEYLSTKPAFARLPFGEWSQVLFNQVVRGHYLFVIDQERRIRGFLGWALTEERLAELWVEGRSDMTNDQCRKGDCVIVNAWSADTANVHRFILDAMHKLFADRRIIYFKRHYAAGRERPVRLVIPTHRKIGAHKAS